MNARNQGLIPAHQGAWMPKNSSNLRWRLFVFSRTRLRCICGVFLQGNHVCLSGYAADIPFHAPCIHGEDIFILWGVLDMSR